MTRRQSVNDGRWCATGLGRSRFPVGTTRDRSGLAPGQAHPMHGVPLNMASVIRLSALMADAYNELPRKLAELRSKPITPLPSLSIAASRPTTVTDRVCGGGRARRTDEGSAI